MRQLDRVSRQLLARAWAAGAGPGGSPLTIDLDSTICETYGLAKEGARHHGYTGQRGYHPLLAVAAGTGDVLMARLREGRANTARGAGHFLRETVGRVRCAKARGQLTVRADSGFYTHALPDGVVGSRHASDIILTRHPIKRLPNSCQMGQRAFPAASGPSMSSAPRPPPAATGPVCPKSAPTIASPCPSRPFPVSPQRGSVNSGSGPSPRGQVAVHEFLEDFRIGYE